MQTGNTVAMRVGNLHYLNCVTDRQQAHAADNQSQKTKEDVWHRRYGHLGVQTLQKLAKEELVDGFDYNSLQAIKSEFFCRPRENRKMWYMLTKSTTFIFCSEIPYGESINVVYFFGLNLLSFSRKYSKTVTSARRYKMPETKATNMVTRTLLIKSSN